MDVVTRILGIESDIQVILRSCSLCPGNARILAGKWQEHQDNHLRGDEMRECSKCGQIKPRIMFFHWGIAAPICRKCTPRKGQHHTGRPHAKTYLERNPASIFHGHGGKKPKPRRINVDSGRGGMSASTKRKVADA